MYAQLFAECLFATFLFFLFIAITAIALRSSRWHIRVETRDTGEGDCGKVGLPLHAVVNSERARFSSTALTDSTVFLVYRPLSVGSSDAPRKSRRCLRRTIGAKSRYSAFGHALLTPR